MKTRKRPTPKKREPLKPVYRVQDREGRGPWRPGFSHVWLGDRPENDYEQLRPIYVERPDVWNLMQEGFHHGCACKTLKQLRNWITKFEWLTLRTHGFDCFEIVPDRIVAETEVQCVIGTREPLSKQKKRVRLY